jgi:CubicO group peptidase (beta-lactamase class C family)
MGLVFRRLAVAGLFFCAVPADVSAQTTPFEWQRAAAEDVRIDPALPETLKANFANNPRLQSFGLVRDGKLVIEHYQRGTGAETLTNFASVTKSVMALLVGIALDKGLIKSVEQPLTDFFPELSEPDVDPKSRTLTLAHLLTMSTGWQSHFNDVPAVNPLDDLKRKVVIAPGETFQYDNASSHLLAIAVARAVHMPLETFAQSHLFGPLGIDRLIWGKDAQGRAFGWHMLQMRLLDMLRIGQLVLDKGQWQGRRIVSEAWIDAMLTHRNAGGPPANLPYGYQWYVLNTPDRKYRAVMGIGYGGQLLYLVPDLRVVIVATHPREQRQADMGFMREIVLPAIRP